MPMTPHRPRCPRARAAHAQRGLTLVELLVASAVGLFLVAGAGLMLTSQLAEHRRVLAETRVLQDLRTAADLVTRDLRRAGYWGNAASGIWTRTASGPLPTNPYTEVAFAASGASASSFGYAYSRDASENESMDSNERFGFRLNPLTQAIEVRLAGSAVTPSNADTWQQLTDPAMVRIRRFEITSTSHTIDLLSECRVQACPPSAAGCPPLQRVREYRLDIDAQDPRDTSVTRSLRSRVRVRNDDVTGRCPD